MLTQTDDSLTDAEFRQISDLVYRHCRINLHDGKKELVRARLSKRMRERGFDSAGAYLETVLADPTGAEFSALVDVLSTNLTQFFREPGHFQYLAEHFLPALAERKRRRGNSRVRVWSAGCSTGEEPYSLAMTILDALPAADGWDVKILATDISRRVLATARAGTYDAARLAEAPAVLRQKYFSRVAGSARGASQAFQAAPALRRVVQFRYLNLVDEWPFAGPFDFIFCRNVMIYFDKPTQELLVGRYWDRLAPGGLLFTGHSESLTGVTHRFRYVQPTIYAKA